jgi:hypothetical protein
MWTAKDGNMHLLSDVTIGLLEKVPIALEEESGLER